VFIILNITATISVMETAIKIIPVTTEH